MSGVVSPPRVDHLPPTQGTEEENEKFVNPAIQARKRFVLFNLMPSWSISFVAHLLLLLAFAVWFLRTPNESPISFSAGTSDNNLLDDIKVDFSGMDLEDSTLEIPDTPSFDDAPKLEEILPTQLEIPDQVQTLTEMMSDATTGALAVSGAVSGMGETGGRTGESRRKMLRENGGTAESEECVELALEWLARHQLKDGSWNFDHSVGPGVRSKRNPGNYTEHRAAATGLALLPFLGSGFTHQEGKYAEVVRNGLRFLVENRGIDTPNGFSFFRANNADDMYSHGIVSIALCEAFAMTQDPWLMAPAQGSIKFIEFAQHSEGGWRYVPKQQGDTSVVGWQIMALKSAKMGGIKVNDEVVNRASRFLDRVSIEYGSHFGYLAKPSEVHGNNKTNTAIGLLCRMYLGWGREQPGIVSGVDFLSDPKRGPYLGSVEYPKGANMYYNYYATQVMMQYGGPKWDKWNVEMREYLIKNMDREGPDRGSWYFPGGDHGVSGAGGGGGPGGRLYCTAMAAMTLEVYYRYMPLYKEKAVEDDFKLR
ncbi:MAG: terpene cyclase/mutase family protein [Pirellulaceae bacterium]|nr:terpene cyclase/mutase family protein [Pirellulaceae bacterium]